MALFLPGYVLTAFLFPRAAELDGFERIALAIALSICATIITALVLAELHIRLSALSDAIGLTAIVVMLTPATVWRRNRVPCEQRYVARVDLQAHLILTGCLIVGLGLATWWTVGTNLGAVDPDFYIANSRGMLSGYPESVRVGSRHQMQIHIDNPTGRLLSFHMTERSGATEIVSMAGHVAAQRSWMRRVDLPAGGPPRRVRVTFELTRVNAPLLAIWLRYRIVSSHI